MSKGVSRHSLAYASGYIAVHPSQFETLASPAFQPDKPCGTGSESFSCGGTPTDDRRWLSSGSAINDTQQVMATSDTLAQLKSRILSHFSMMFLSTWEEERWEAELAALATEMDRGLVTWTVTRGVEGVGSLFQAASPGLT